MQHLSLDPDRKVESKKANGTTVICCGTDKAMYGDGTKLVELMQELITPSKNPTIVLQTDGLQTFLPSLVTRALAPSRELLKKREPLNAAAPAWISQWKARKNKLTEQQRLLAQLHEVSLSIKGPIAFHFIHRDIKELQSSLFDPAKIPEGVTLHFHLAGTNGYNATRSNICESVVGTGKPDERYASSEDTSVYVQGYQIQSEKLTRINVTLLEPNSDIAKLAGNILLGNGFRVHGFQLIPNPTKLMEPSDLSTICELLLSKVSIENICRSLDCSLHAGFTSEKTVRQLQLALVERHIARIGNNRADFCRAIKDLILNIEWKSKTFDVNYQKFLPKNMSAMLASMPQDEEDMGWTKASDEIGDRARNALDNKRDWIDRVKSYCSRDCLTEACYTAIAKKYTEICQAEKREKQQSAPVSEAKLP